MEISSREPRTCLLPDAPCSPALLVAVAQGGWQRFWVGKQKEVNAFFLSEQFLLLRHAGGRDMSRNYKPGLWAGAVGTNILVPSQCEPQHRFMLDLDLLI